MTRRQAARYVLAQATHLAAVSLPPGILGGLVLAWAMSAATLPITGIQVAFRIDPTIVVVSLVLAVATALVGGWLPARRAARLRVFEALAYE